MTTLPQLLNILEPLDGRPRVDLDYRARVIREAGFVATGKRGGGAARLDFTAAANLLIGLNLAESPKDAPNVIVSARGFKSSQTPREGDPDIIRALDAAENFGEALEVLLAGAPALVVLAEGLIESAFGGDYSDEDRRALVRQTSLGMGPIVLRVELTRTRARLAFETPTLKTKTQWESKFWIDAFAPGFNRIASADRQVSIRFGAPTIIAVYEAVAGRSVFAEETDDAGPIASSEGRCND